MRFDGNKIACWVTVLGSIQTSPLFHFACHECPTQKRKLSPGGPVSSPVCLSVCAPLRSRRRRRVSCFLSWALTGLIFHVEVLCNFEWLIALLGELFRASRKRLKICNLKFTRNLQSKRAWAPDVSLEEFKGGRNSYHRQIAKLVAVQPPQFCHWTVKKTETFWEIMSVKFARGKRKVSSCCSDHDWRYFVELPICQIPILHIRTMQNTTEGMKSRFSEAVADFRVSKRRPTRWSIRS